MSEFKVGDRVYCPMVGTKVYTLVGSKAYTRGSRLLIEDNPDSPLIHEDGTRLGWANAPVVFHANETNHKLLCELYGKDFDTVPVRPRGEHVVKAMLEDGWLNVPCFVDSREIRSLADSSQALIRGVDKTGIFLSSGLTWRYVQPYDPRTGKLIVDYVNGEVVLED